MCSQTQQVVQRQSFTRMITRISTLFSVTFGKTMSRVLPPGRGREPRKTRQIQKGRRTSPCSTHAKLFVRVFRGIESRSTIVLTPRLSYELFGSSGPWICTLPHSKQTAPSRYIFLNFFLVRTMSRSHMNRCL